MTEHKDNGQVLYDFEAAIGTHSRNDIPITRAAVLARMREPEREVSEQERGRQLVHREVMCCLSSIVSTLASGHGSYTWAGHHALNPQYQGLDNLAEQAFELASPIQDYEETVIQDGWTRDPDEPGWIKVNPDTGSTRFRIDAETVCADFDLEVYEREVYEFWAVSDWFGRKLADQGEKVDFDFGNLVVWARTTTGQAIYCDGVVERIVRDLWKPEPTPEPTPEA